MTGLNMEFMTTLNLKHYRVGGREVDNVIDTQRKLVWVIGSF